MENLPCKHCKHFVCSYIKSGCMNIECDKRYLEIEFDLDSPFCCGKFKPNKKYKKQLRLTHQHKDKPE